MTPILVKFTARNKTLKIYHCFLLNFELLNFWNFPERVLLENLSYENEFVFHENQNPSEPHFPSCHTWDRTEKSLDRVAKVKKDITLTWKQQERTFSNYYHAPINRSILMLMSPPHINTNRKLFVVRSCSSIPCWTTLGQCFFRWLLW